MEMYHGGYNTIEALLTKEQFWVLAKFKHPTHQINFCTEEAIKCLAFIKSEKIKL